MRSFLVSAVVQWAAYLVLTVNFRAIAGGHYAYAGATAMLAAFLAYTIVRRVTRDETWATALGMMVGGACGDISGIWLTRHWS